MILKLNWTDFNTKLQKKNNKNGKSQQSKIILAKYRILSNGTQDFNVGMKK
jgi:hypothetical protein